MSRLQAMRQQRSVEREIHRKLSDDQFELI
ncbi:hypothetical protein BH09PAT3_BH09PAT3_2000 [soil metagenome]